MWEVEAREEEEYQRQLLEKQKAAKEEERRRAEQEFAEREGLAVAASLDELAARRAEAEERMRQAEARAAELENRKDVADAWADFEDEEENVYFYNGLTGETVWECPEVYQARYDAKLEEIRKSWRLRLDDSSGTT